jgi:exonuclease III
MASSPLNLGKIEEDEVYNFLRKFIPDSNDSDFSSTDDVNSPYTVADFNCRYVDENSFASNIIRTDSNLSVMSLNIQSLPAKYSDLFAFITDRSIHNNAPDIICLQEVWNVLDVNLFPLPGYHPLICTLRSKSPGGGVGIYIKSDLYFKPMPVISIFAEKILETIFVEIILLDKQKIIIGSVYRPNSKHTVVSLSEQFSQFYDFFSNILAACNDTNLETLILGDFNLDVLQLNELTNVNSYIDL